MNDWEINLQKVDKVLYTWMHDNGIPKTSPPLCIEVLEKEGIYSPTDRPGRPLRDDLRDARSASGVKDSETFIYCTEHLKFEQAAKKKSWKISMKIL